MTPVSLDNLAAAVMGAAVLSDHASGKLQDLAPPAAGRIAKRLGVRAETVRFLWARRYGRVGTAPLEKIAQKFGGRIATRHGVPVFVQDHTTSVAVPVPDRPISGRTVPAPADPSALLARVRQRDREAAERGAAYSRAAFDITMAGVER